MKTEEVMKTEEDMTTEEDEGIVNGFDAA